MRLLPQWSILRGYIHLILFPYPDFPTQMEHEADYSNDPRKKFVMKRKMPPHPEM